MRLVTRTDAARVSLEASDHGLPPQAAHTSYPGGSPLLFRLPLLLACLLSFLGTLLMPVPASAQYLRVDNDWVTGKTIPIKLTIPRSSSRTVPLLVSQT